MSIKIKTYNQKAEAVGEMELTDQIFGVKVNEDLVHQAAVAQMGNERPVLAHTKDRSEVRGGGRKPWRQKGTGRARAGSSRSPIWKGGGVTFGPTKERNFKKQLNKKMKQQALCMVLSDKVGGDNLTVLDKLETSEFKTKVFNGILTGLEKKVFKIKQESKKAGIQKNKKTKKQESDEAQKGVKAKIQKRSILIINDKKDAKVKYSGRNLAGVEMLNLDNINILDLLKYKNVILTKAGIKKLEKNYG